MTGRTERSPDRADGYDALIQDHRRVAGRFEQYSKTRDEAVAHEIFDALALHTEAEERVSYPVVELQVPAGAPLAERAESEHALVSGIVALLEEAPPQDLRPTMDQLRVDVEAHVRFDEESIFPQLRDTGVDTERLDVELAAAKRDARARH